MLVSAWMQSSTAGMTPNKYAEKNISSLKLLQTFLCNLRVLCGEITLAALDLLARYFLCG